MNVVVLRGTLTRPPESRVLASGQSIVGFEVKTASSEVGTQVAPVVWENPPPSAATMVVGCEVVVAGTIRRRFFRAGGATSSRTEVLASAVIPSRRVKAAQRLVEEALAEVEGIPT